MTVRPIITDVVALCEMCDEVPLNVIPTEPIQSLITEMATTLALRHDGAALAAPQIGIKIRLAVVVYPEFMVLINPVITSRKGTRMSEEGCLSLPGRRYRISRPAHIVFEYYNEKGQKVKNKASGFLAAVICHEIDHLDGRLIIDHIQRKK